jgi:hypothetical protein
MKKKKSAKERSGWKVGAAALLLPETASRQNQARHPVPPLSALGSPEEKKEYWK